MRNLDLIDGIVDSISNFKPHRVFLTKCAAHTGIAGNERADLLAKEAVEDVWRRQEISAINRRTAYKSLPWLH